LQPVAEGIIVGGMSKKREPSPQMVDRYVRRVVGEDIHAKRVLSMSNVVLGIVAAGALGIHAIGRGLAAAKGLVEKHAVKQVDRLIGNAKLTLDDFFALWVPFVLAGRPQIIVALDWSEFDDDDQSMLVASILTAHGRATPLIWKTVLKSTLKDNRDRYEDELMYQLWHLVHGKIDVKVTIVADRGFCDKNLYFLLKDVLEFDFIIRFRGNILVTSSTGETKPAIEWVGKGGRMRVLRNALVTADRFSVQTVICVQDKGMKDPWCIVASDPTLEGNRVKRYYGKRFSIEESFRDIKDIRFGLAMKWRRIGTPDRRDRMMMMAVLAISLLTLLGEAGERVGMDKMLKTNTSKKRQLSLFRQGLRWYDHLPNLREDRLELLMGSFVEVMKQHRLCQVLFGAI
jgi:hypothetical protein